VADGSAVAVADVALSGFAAFLCSAGSDADSSETNDGESNKRPFHFLVFDHDEVNLIQQPAFKGRTG
jgi:hypothetical protein